MFTVIFVHIRRKSSIESENSSGLRFDGETSPQMHLEPGVQVKMLELHMSCTQERQAEDDFFSPQLQTPRSHTGMSWPRPACLDRPLQALTQTFSTREVTDLTNVGPGRRTWPSLRCHCQQFSRLWPT